MKNNKRAISFIALIITIAVLIIVSTLILQKGMQRTDDARIAKHNQNITAMQEEVESYYYYKGASLPVVNLTPYPIHSGSTLEAEIIKNGGRTTAFIRLIYQN